MYALQIQQRAVGLDPWRSQSECRTQAPTRWSVRGLNSARHLHSQVFLSADSRVSRIEMEQAPAKTVRIHDLCDLYVTFGAKIGIIGLRIWPRTLLKWTIFRCKDIAARS